MIDLTAITFFSIFLGAMFVLGLIAYAAGKFDNNDIKTTEPSLKSELKKLEAKLDILQDELYRLNGVNRNND